MKRRHEDATVWIGYADFLTTIAVLFFLIAAVAAAKVRHARDARIEGVVTDSASQQRVAGCQVQSTGAPAVQTGAQGRFTLRVDSISDVVRVSVEVRCKGYSDRSQLVRIVPDQTTSVVFQVAPADDTRWKRITLSGDALFDPLQFTLKPEGVQLLMQAGDSLKKDLRPGDMIVVQGHTDDLPIPAGYRKTNWMLSGERAAAAVPVLIDSVGIPPCQVSVMGLGPSRPFKDQQVTFAKEETDAQRAAKRAKNRRIEIWRVSGLAIISGNCVL